MKSKNPASYCVHDDIIDNKFLQPHTAPIYATSTFVYPDVETTMDVFQGNAPAYIYSRWNNPSFELIEQKIARLEAMYGNEEAFSTLFSSGMAAISAVVQAELKPGDKIITHKNIYGTIVEYFTTVLQQKNVEVIFHNFEDIQSLENKIKQDKNIKLIYVETPNNPTTDCYDLQDISRIAKTYNCTTACDATFASPLLQQTLAFGIDYSIHSSTKFLNGHSNALGGIVTTHQLPKHSEMRQQRKLMGAVPSAFDAWLLNMGIKTLHLRIQQHCNNTLRLAEWLLQQPQVAQVHYVGLPSHRHYLLAQKQMQNGFGGVLSFELNGNLQDAIAFMSRIQFCTLTASLGTPDTLIQHPASMSHVKVPKPMREEVGITDTLIRVSVGLEYIQDIIADIQQALVF